MGFPYGASPITLYSPEFTLKPVKYVKAEYNNPRECGKLISFKTFKSELLPRATEDVAHSPTPSMVKIAADLNGEGKNALDAWLKWCSEKRIFFDQSTSQSIFFRSPIIIFFGKVYL